MAKERLSRRDFLKVAGGASLAPLLKERRPMTELPVMWTKGTPLRAEQLTRGGWRMDYTAPGYEMYKPDWIKVSGMPFDFLTPIRPEPDLEVPEEMEPLGPVPWVADLPHVTGLQPTLLKAIVGYGLPGRPPRYLNVAYESKEASDIVSTYAFTDRLRIYPSKIYNILTAFYSIAEWQKKNGPMLPGNTYSYLEMTGAANRNAERYLTGGYLDAGGICAGVATLSKTSFIAQHRGLTEEVMRFLHKPNIQYAENPLDPGITKENSDATVSFVIGRPATHKDNGDFKFEIEETSLPLYFSFAAHTRLNKEPIYKNSPARHSVQPADARLTFSVSLVKKRPDFDAEMERLLSLREEYARFHNFTDGFRGSYNEQP